MGILLVALIFTFAVTVHEFFHGLIAYWLGDDTAKRAGRLTLNPLAHIDPIGFLCLIIFRIGWARPVPIDERNFKYPRLFSALVGIAGPLSNFLFATLALFGLHHIAPLFSGATCLALQSFFKTMSWINIMLGVFNIVPLPPLDGSHLLRALLPTSWLPAYYHFMRYSIFLLLFLLLLPQTHIALLLAMEWVTEVLECLVV